MNKKEFVCPRCFGYIPNNFEIGKYAGAISRRDNKTEICSACGIFEAFEAFDAQKLKEAAAVDKHIEVRWIGIDDKSNVASMKFTWLTAASDVAICNQLYEATNVYAGSVWDSIVAFIPKSRSHTALSVGDQIVINQVVYECADFGWSVVEQAGV
jgi:hypothetical protein